LNASGHKLTVLVLGTESFSAHGGLSTLNRELSIALGSLGHDVWCFVPTAQAEEKAHAQRLGVNLIEADLVSGLPEYSRLLIPPPLPEGVQSDLIIGHGRVTGPAAAVQARSRFPGSLRAHFIHVYPGDIEWFKDYAREEDVAHRAEARELEEVDLARDVDLAVAVGPLLTREFNTLLAPYSRTVYEFAPALNECDELGAPPPGIRCLGHSKQRIEGSVSLSSSPVSPASGRARSSMISL
jgi:glycosyltransferase involved in cell wall biosynthesis